MTLPAAEVSLCCLMPVWAKYINVDRENTAINSWNMLHATTLALDGKHHHMQSVTRLTTFIRVNHPPPAAHLSFAFHI